MAGDDDADDGDDIFIETDEPSTVAAIQRAQPEFEFDDIAPAKPAAAALAAAPLTAAVAAAIEAMPAAAPAPAPAVTAAPVQKTPADIAAEVISDVQPTPSTGTGESVVTPSGEVVPAVVVTDEAVEPVIVPAPEPVEPEPVTEVVVDRLAGSEDTSSIANTLPGEIAEPNADASTEVEPASTAAASTDEEPAEAAASQSPVEELPRTAGLFDNVPQPMAPGPADAAAKAAEHEGGERRA